MFLSLSLFSVEAALPMPFGSNNGHTKYYPSKKDECKRVSGFDCDIKVDNIYRDHIYVSVFSVFYLSLFGLHFSKFTSLYSLKYSG